MVDTATPDLKLRLPGTGDYNNSWGSVLNSDAFTLLDHSIAGRVTIPLDGVSTYALPALVIGTASNSRYFCLSFTGTPSAAPTVTVPASVTKKLYLIDNQTGQTLTLKYASGTGVEISTGTRFLVWCDGAEVYAVAAQATNANSLGGVAAANYARLDIANAFQKANSFTPVTVTDGATLTIDAALGNVFHVTISANRAVANPTNPANGQPIWFLVSQDATGGRTLSWSSKWKFASGTAPTLSSTANAVDAFLAVYISSLDMWLVLHHETALNTSGSGGSGNSYTINSNSVDWRLIDLVGAGAGAINVTVTVATGITVQALSAGVPAVDLSGLDAGSTVNLVNNGYILGRGGNGGIGAVRGDSGGDDWVMLASAGRAGGDAVKGPGAGITFNVTNSNGRIWGGGGGGGGGDAHTPANNDNDWAAGGGGGGGAGGGFGGEAGQGSLGRANTGGNGSTGSAGTNGTGGTGNNSGGAASGAGGNGGDWGAAGSDGTNAGAARHGTGGAAGKAINLNGGSMGTFSGSSAPNIRGAVS